MTATPRSLPRIARRLASACALLGAAWSPMGLQAGEVSAEIEERLRLLAEAHAQARPAAAGDPAPRITRVEVSVGALDSRIKLAPCARMEPYLPPGLKPWGRTRVGVRCVEGPTRWNVFLPVTVRVFGPALTARSPLTAGAELALASLAVAEVDLAADDSPVLLDAAELAGRRLARPLPAGEALRNSHLRPKQWFSAGDPVRIVARGKGFAVSGEGRALTPGIDGKAARIRTDSGRIVMGVAHAERSVEVRL